MFTKRRKYMWMYLIPVIICVIIALFSDEIDDYFKCDKKLKKVLVTFSCGIIAVCMIAAVLPVIL